MNVGCVVISDYALTSDPRACYRANIKGGLTLNGRAAQLPPPRATQATEFSKKTEKYLHGKTILGGDGGPNSIFISMPTLASPCQLLAFIIGIIRLWLNPLVFYIKKWKY